jgi:hypothetical protein
VRAACILRLLGLLAPCSVGFEADATSYKTWNSTDDKIHVYTKQP